MKSIYCSAPDSYFRHLEDQCKNADQQLELLSVFQHRGRSQGVEFRKSSGSILIYYLPMSSMSFYQIFLEQVEDGRDGGNPEFDGEVTDQYTAEVTFN